MMKDLFVQFLSNFSKPKTQANPAIIAVWDHICVPYDTSRIWHEAEAITTDDISDREDLILKVATACGYNPVCYGYSGLVVKKKEARHYRLQWVSEQG